MDSTDLAYLSIADLAEQFPSRKLSPVEVIESMLERTARLEPKLSAYITLMADAALEDARRAEREIMNGEYRGPLHGVPVGVKDNFWLKDVPTTAGSRAFADFIPTEDSAVVTRLREAGAVITGKTNVPELSSVPEHVLKMPRNPWNIEHFPGASSTGSAIILSAGMAYGAVGSDTAGSIRFPAAFCGVTGLKPTLGRISVYGMFPTCPNFDHAGPMARSALDCALLLDALAGSDPRDRNSLDDLGSRQGWATSLARPLNLLRIGVPRAYFWGDLLQPDVARHAEAALRAWQELGWIVREVDLPEMEPIVEAASIVHLADGAAVYRGLLCNQPDLVGPMIRESLELGLKYTAVEYIAALETWKSFGQALSEIFQDVDLLVTPTRAGTAPRQAADGTLLDPLPAEGFRSPFNLPGVPAMSIPCGFDSKGLPIGIQIIGPRLRENLVLAAGHAYQQITDWHLRRPPVDDLAAVSV